MIEDVIVIKGILGFLVLINEEMRLYKIKVCISCFKCVFVCFMGFVLFMFDRLVVVKEYEEMVVYNLMDCIECGFCVYICFVNRFLVEFIKIGKVKLRVKKK